MELLAVGERGACAFEEDFEPRGVECVRLEPKQVTGLSGLEQPVAEHLAQLRDVGV